MKIASGPITQLAWVTIDLDQTERFLGEHFDIRRWTRLEGIHFSPDDCRYRGRPADFIVDISLAYSGDLQLELIRPVSGTSIYTDFLETHGSGLHHLCFEVDDMALALKAADASGLDVVQRGVMAGGAMEFAYIDGARWGTPYVEIARIGPDMQIFFDTIKAGTP